MKRIICALMLILESVASFACGCSTSSLSKAIENSDEIFVGKIKKIEFIYFTHYTYRNVADTIPTVAEDEYSIKKLTFEVEKKWKGSLNKYVTIYEGGTSCHLEFNTYDKYIVFAYQSPIYIGWAGAPKINGLTSDICNRTQSDPDRYPKYVDEDSIDEEQPFNDKAELDKIFPTPIRLINFEQLYMVLAVLGILIILIIIKKRLITPHKLPPAS